MAFTNDALRGDLEAVMKAGFGKALAPDCVGDGCGIGQRHVFRRQRAIGDPFPVKVARCQQFACHGFEGFTEIVERALAQ